MRTVTLRTRWQACEAAYLERLEIDEKWKKGFIKA